MSTHSHRDHFFSVLEGKRPVNMPFIPDISGWYMAQRTPANEPLRYPAGTYIPDTAPLHHYRGTMPEPFKDFTFMDFYREFDWGLHSHTYNWLDTEYSTDIERTVRELPGERSIRLQTSTGKLTRRLRLAANRTWCPCEHFVKDVDELEIMARVVESQVFVPRYDRLEKAIQDIGEMGQIDLVISRSPLGKLVHEYMGFENTIYGLHDAPNVIHDFLRLQEERDMEVVRLAAAAPGRLVMISDHADENLIAPNLYKQYCIPFYQKATRVLHEAGKFVSTHLDGNFKGFFPLLAETGFDVLDGCTPAPMFNFEVEELAEAMPERMCAFCGVPATLFCQNLSNESLFTFADRIMTAFKGRGIVNVGDILPADGDIEQVIALGKHVKHRNAEG